MENPAEEGMALLESGRAKEAAEALEKLHLKKALTGRARVVLAQAYFEVFRLKDAERLLQDEALDDDAHALRLRAELALEAQRHDEAISYARLALQHNGEDARAREILILLQEMPAGPGHAPMRRRQPSLARTLRHAALAALILAIIVVVYAWRVQTRAEADALVKEARLARDKMDKTSLQTAVSKAKAALELLSHEQALGVWAEAEALLAYEYAGLAPTESVQRVTAQDVRSGERYFAEAVTLVNAGAAHRAQTLASEVVAKGAADARVLLALGLAEKALGRLAAAKDALKRAYELSPFHPLIATELGDAYLLEGDLRNADYYWRKAHEASPAFDRAKLRLDGDVSKMPNDVATQCLLAYQAPTPEKWEALAQRFPGTEALVFQWARSKPTQAESVLQRTPEVASSPRGQALLAELTVPSDNKKAEALAKGVLATDPKQADALFVLGRVAQVRGEQQRALELYTQALQQRATFPEVYQQVGNVFVDAKDFAKGREQLLVAERMYKQGSAPQPVLARLYEDLARCAEKAGNSKEAAGYRALKKGGRQ